MNERLKTLLRHLNNVQENTQVLGEKLYESGETALGLALIANGRVHDHSKFSGVEWLYLHGDIKEANPALFKLAAQHHVTTNLHHPEAWAGGIEEMDRLHLAELACDWTARGNEFGTDVWEYLKETGCEKYGFSKHGRVYKEIKDFLEMLLAKRFS